MPGVSQAARRAIWLPGPPQLAALHEGELPQKDGLCGPFWLSLALRSRGITAPGGAELGQDVAAVAAGSKLAHGDPYRWLPPDESSRVDYEADLPVVDEDASGTSVTGLMQAAKQLGGGAVAAIPVAGPWTKETVGSLFESAAVDPTAMLLANVQTGSFVGSHASFRELIEAAYGLSSEPPPSDWDVGHFVNPMLYLETEHDALVLVRDTYRSLGLGAHHWQTAASLAAALTRSDGRQGGVLVLCSPTTRPAIEARAAAAGLHLGPWDNGTPDP